MFLKGCERVFSWREKNKSTDLMFFSVNTVMLSNFITPGRD